jgi:hypothetical protein
MGHHIPAVREPWARPPAVVLGRQRGIRGRRLGDGDPETQPCDTEAAPPTACCWGLRRGRKTQTSHWIKLTLMISTKAVAQMFMLPSGKLATT